MTEDFSAGQSWMASRTRIKTRETQPHKIVTHEKAAGRFNLPHVLKFMVSRGGLEPPTR